MALTAEFQARHAEASLAIITARVVEGLTDASVPPNRSGPAAAPTSALSHKAMHAVKRAVRVLSVAKHARTDEVDPSKLDAALEAVRSGSACAAGDHYTISKPEFYMTCFCLK